MAIEDCKIIQLPKISDPRGNLTFLESHQHIPFDIKRVFYLYDIPTGSDRGAHAHKTLHQFIICLSGSFDVLIKDGKEQKVIHQNSISEQIAEITKKLEGKMNTEEVLEILRSINTI